MREVVWRVRRGVGGMEGEGGVWEVWRVRGIVYGKGPYLKGCASLQWILGQWVSSNVIILVVLVPAFHQLMKAEEDTDESTLAAFIKLTEAILLHEVGGGSGHTICYGCYGKQLVGKEWEGQHVYV